MRNVELSLQQKIDFRDHVLESYPNEACGVIADGRYQRLTNTSRRATIEAKPDMREWIAIEQKSHIDAFLHSHCSQPGQVYKWPRNWPSATDLESQHEMQIPWGIVSTCGEGISDFVWIGNGTQPILGRDYVIGVSDCFNLVSDWFLLNKQVQLGFHSRDEQWMDSDYDWFESRFKAEGFVEIQANEYQVGDVVLIRIGNRKHANHCAVITDTNQITHQLFKRFSSTDRLDRWQKLVTHYLRFNHA